MSRTITMRRAGVLACAALATGLASGTACAQNAAAFFKGKTVTLNVGFGAGGGYDTTTRLVARHLGKHIPGNPTVVVANMPGAGSMRVAGWIYSVAPKDGTMLGVAAASIMLEPLFGNKNAKFDPAKFEWIGSMHNDTNSCAVWKGAGVGIKTLDDMIKSKKTIVFGSLSPETETTRFPMFLKHVAKAPIKVVHGYRGTKPIMLAIQKGELDATCGMYESSVKTAYRSELASGDLKVVFHVDLDRDTVPTFGDAVGVRQFLKTDEMKKIGEILFRPTSITRPIFAPPGTPKDRVEALRKALMDTMKDPATVADGKKLEVEFNPMEGKRIGEIMEGFKSTPPELVKKALEMSKFE
ncbi:MAG: Bug family tripartite tricarboxylate transporter substrate binding protein [Beijerinckiaceae bacterium]